MSGKLHLSSIEVEQKERWPPLGELSRRDAELGSLPCYQIFVYKSIFICSWKHFNVLFFLQTGLCDFYCINTLLLLLSDGIILTWTVSLVVLLGVLMTYAQMEMKRIVGDNATLPCQHQFWGGRWPHSGHWMAAPEASQQAESGECLFMQEVKYLFKIEQTRLIFMRDSYVFAGIIKHSDVFIFVHVVLYI